MTNEKKERLKAVIEQVFIGDVGHRYPDERWARDTLLDLIDRQPSEEEAKDATDWIQHIRTRCASSNDDVDNCGDCMATSDCDEQDNIICEALGIEGKE